MSNSDDVNAQAARGFHEATKLSYINLLTKPPLYKTYPGLPQLTLPEAMPPGMPALEAVSRRVVGGSNPLDLAAIAQVLHYSAGLIRKSNLASAGEVHYRAAASAGALYPIELYLVCGNLPGLAAGVYHYAPADNALTQIRSGDFRRTLAVAAADESLAGVPATIICTAVFWRSAWKYRERGYRYCFWDNGTVLSNILATAGSLGLPARVIGGFVDPEVDRLLGADSALEASTCMVALGETGELAENPGDLLDIKQDDLGFSEPIPYPESALLQREACLASAPDVVRWRGVEQSAQAQASPAPELSSGRLGEVIAQRGSTRRFAREPISLEQFSELLAASCTKIPADFGGGLVEPYIIVNDVEGLQSGSYHYSSESNDMELLQAGEFREEAGHLTFEQALGADSGAVVFFLADLEAILGRFGNRGYRVAQLEAGVMGGNMYLCAHSLGLGATGMTFFDDAVTAFFSPHAAGKSLMFLVALGRTATPNRVRPFRSKYGVMKDSLARGAGGGRRAAVPDWLYSN